MQTFRYKTRPVFSHNESPWLFVRRLYDQSDVELTIYPKPDKDEFECQLCMDRFCMGARDPEASKLEKSVSSIRRHAANKDHIMRLHVSIIVKVAEQVQCVILAVQ